MAWEAPNWARKPEWVPVLALLLALIGLVLIYFWPTQSDYLYSTPNQLSLLPNGQWVQVDGQVNAVTVKPAGYSLKLCSGNDGCVTVSVGQSQAQAFGADGQPPPVGIRLTVQGETAAFYSNRYILAHRIMEG